MKVLLAVVCAVPLLAQVPVGNPKQNSLKEQPFNRPESCLPCHQRQYDELRQSVKAGYRNVSPLMNALELAGNFLSGGLLRPVYSDSPDKRKTDGTVLNSNLVTSTSFTDLNQVRAGFCLGCHGGPIILRGNADPNAREVPELPGVGANFRPDLIRPLRDYHLVDSRGTQILPEQIGGPPPAGARPSLGAAGITCDLCHNVSGPDLNRSFQRDGYANMSLAINPTIDKVGPFLFPVAVKGNFHVASRDPERINFLRSGDFCNACHDVRVPLAAGGNLTARETDINPGGAGVTHYRLENLSTEWQRGPYNSTNNPFGKVIRCQDCHMSLFPYAGNSTYKVDDQTITSPTPAIFPENFAAVPGVSTEFDFPLQKRQVVTHYLTGIDVPILSHEELKARLGGDYPDPNEIAKDEYGHPRGIAQRRVDVLNASVRINLDKTDRTARTGQDFVVRLTATALTGHRFPSGFSQERTTYVELTVKDAKGFLLYQSGYQVDKPHPDTGEMEPDGQLNDEDLEHLVAVMDPGRHVTPFAAGAANNGQRNQVFIPGPDNGPEARVYGGEERGLVLFRNELTRIFLPGDGLGRSDARGNPIIVQKPHFEETFSAGFANAVDNFRALAPLRPTTFRYRIKLPTAEELRELGRERIEGPLQVHAQINFEHFPPLFLRFLSRATGPNGPSGHEIGLLNEQKIDAFLRNNRSIASADFRVDVVE